MKICVLDFEFNGTAEPRLNLVSVAAVCFDEGVETYRRSFWLYSSPNGNTQPRRFFEHIMALGYTFVAYAMEAEARSLLTLFGENRTWLKDFKAIDLYLEYRCLLNHNHELSYGQQYLNGKVIRTTPPPPKWVRDEQRGMEDEEAHHRPSFSLAGACYKLLGIKIDAKVKDDIRQLIIRGNSKEIAAARASIMIYNESDIAYLRPLLKAVIARYSNPEAWLKAALLRGDYAVRTARMVELGYPVNMEKVRHFVTNIDKLLSESVKQVLESDPTAQAFRWAKKEKRWAMNEKPIREWITKQNLPHWRLTSGKKLSLSKDAFADWFSSESEGFAGAFCHHLNTKRSLNGFVSNSTKRGIFTDFVGFDNRARPYFGIYGSQASRSQPGAVGFIPLKAHWMRNFIEPPPGRAMAGVDYASQEFLLAAILSQDLPMMDAYASGDVYLAFGKAAGLIPPEGTKETHKKVRDMCKTIVLGISYDLSARGLAPRLSRITGETWTEERAQGLIDIFYEVYSGYADWKWETQREYEESGQLELCDGWTMWADNDNPRSVGNFPVQGHGAVIMRRAVALAQDQGLDVCFTLHDALYIEFDSYDISAVEMLKSCMTVAFNLVMSNFGQCKPIRLEGEMWSPDYKNRLPTPVKDVVSLPEYVDEKGRKDLDRYRPFFTATTP